MEQNAWGTCVCLAAVSTLCVCSPQYYTACRAKQTRKCALTFITTFTEKTTLCPSIRHFPLIKAYSLSPLIRYSLLHNVCSNLSESFSISSHYRLPSNSTRAYYFFLLIISSFTDWCLSWLVLCTSCYDFISRVSWPCYFLWQDLLLLSYGFRSLGHFSRIESVSNTQLWGWDHCCSH